jgi:hypothetical protein
MIINTNPAVQNSPLVAWDNLIGQGTLTATSGDVSGLLNGVTTDPWLPDAIPATVTLTLASSATASAVCFAAHDMGSKSVTVTVERWDGAAWVSVATASPADDMPLILSFAPVASTQWRAVFTGASVFQLAVLTIGPGLVFPGRIIPPVVHLDRVSEVTLVGDSESGTGEFLQADFERTGGRSFIQLSAQLPDFAAGEAFEAFRQHFNRGRPFFMAQFPTYRPSDVGYMWRGQGAASIVVPMQDAVFMSVAMECSVYVG